MKLVTFQILGFNEPRVGCLIANRVLDLAAWGKACGLDIPDTLLGLIQTDRLPSVRQALERPAPEELTPHTYTLGSVKLLAPLPRPGKILCSGINYRSHCQENPAAKIPDEPFFFAKMPSTVIGPGDPIVLPKRSRQVDYEVEFAVVIGRSLKDAREDTVMSAVFGYTILHDVSARDVQFKDNQITLGKNFDSFTPLGPCIVTADEIAVPSALALKSRVNGDLRQNGSNRDWVFSLPRLLTSLSQVMTLEPGDVVSTGTPAGVGLFRQPPEFLKPGDVVELEIESIGILRNPVVAA